MKAITRENQIYGRNTFVIKRKVLTLRKYTDLAPWRNLPRIVRYHADADWRDAECLYCKHKTADFKVFIS